MIMLISAASIARPGNPFGNLEQLVQGNQARDHSAENRCGVGAVAGTVLGAGFPVFRSLPQVSSTVGSVQRAGQGLILDEILTPR